MKGLDEVLANLSREVQAIEGRTRAGMQEVGLFIKGEAVEITPHRKGVLRGSAFYSTDNGARGSGPRVRIGYTAKYAPYVHEMPDPYIPKSELVGPSMPRGYNFVGPKKHGSRGVKRGKKSYKFVGPKMSGRMKAMRSMGPRNVQWTTPGTGPKFLEKAVKNNIPEIVDIIRDSARVRR